MGIQRPDIQIKRFEIVSNRGKTLEISNGFSQMYYYESLLENSVKLTVTYADTGTRNDSSDSTSSTEAGDIDLQYAEKIYLDIEDDERSRLQFITPDTCLHFMARPKIIGSTRNEIITAQVSTKEYLTNQFEKNRVSKTYEGKISETVQSILTEHLKTKKKLFVEDTLNNLKIDGRIDMESTPFNVINKLSKKSVPIITSKNAVGYTAGFFFYETSEGYHFKSIDNLLNQNPFKRYIMNNTVTLPPGYNDKILSYTFPEGPSLVQQQLAGTIKSSKATFNPVTHTIDKSTIDTTQQNRGVIRAAKNVPFVPEEFQEATLTTFNTLDIGQHPYGISASEQVKNSQQENLKVGEIINQSKMRFNQLFALPLSITIFSDMTLHPGQMIECVFPEVSTKITQRGSRKKSGKYLIVDMCHYISPVGPQFTRLNLVRDSYGV